MKKEISRLIKTIRSSSLLQLVLLVSASMFVGGTIIFFLEVRRNTAEFSSIWDGLWWAVVTFSTTGYGDKVPITVSGRTMATLGIFFGLGATSALSGALASIFVDRNTQARRGLMEFPKLKNHYIICGWKDSMADILVDILNTDFEITSEDLLLISSVSGEKITELKDQKELSGIHFVRGDYSSEGALKRANVKGARKIIILADTSNIRAVSEVDSKTVMTVLSVKTMAKTVYTCAELLDRKYEAYLRQAMCDEILFSRDLTRRIIANTTTINGMAHIMGVLLAGGTDGGSRLNTIDISDQYIGVTYGYFGTELCCTGERVLLGILENTGSPNRIKMEALRAAQKTADTSTLISNLRMVKELEFNNPVFIPPKDYILKKYSKAIVLERLGEM